MQYLNLHLPTTTRSPRFIGCEPVQRSTWVSLLSYCAEQENGGIIMDCGDWGDRRWMQSCGVTKEEVRTKCGLWSWQDGGLIVWGYPAEKEQEVKAKREGGRIGGLRSGQSRSEAKLQGKLQAQLERNGIGREKEEEGNERARAEVPSAEEVVTYGSSVLSDQIPETFCRHYHEQKEIKRTWQNGNGIMIDWRREIRSWWTKDRHTWSTTKANPKAVRSQFCIPNI